MHESILLAAEALGRDAVTHSLTLMRNCSAALLPPVSRRFIAAFSGCGGEGGGVGEVGWGGAKGGSGEVGRILDGCASPFVVVPTYAMTESFPICSNPPALSIKLATVGPAMGPQMRILRPHPHDVECEEGEEGEVAVCGPCVTSGYLYRSHMDCDPNIEAYSLPSSAVGRMLRTGDKGFVDPDGYLQLVGRFKEIINCGGEKISPLELEDQILAVPGVETCVCFAAPAELYGEVVGVAVVPKAGACDRPTIEAVRSSVNSKFKPQARENAHALSFSTST